MSEPLIPVIVPVYNAEKYIEKCVASIRAQTYRNLEIILVDDGSCDRSGELCEAFALEDSRIVVIRKENGGVASARNAGLDAMHGDYVGFVDADDWIDPEMYEVLLQRMIAENAQIWQLLQGRKSQDILTLIWTSSLQLVVPMLSRN